MQRTAGPKRPLAFLVGLTAGLIGLLSSPSWGQATRLPSGNAVPISPGLAASPDAPQTRLAPITPPQTFSNPAPQFDPYATTPGNSGISGGGYTAPSTQGVIPAPLPSNSGPALPPGGATIGPPTAINPSPTFGGAAPGSIPPSPPGGSLFSRIFSRPASSPTLNAPVYGAPQGGGFSNGTFAPGSGVGGGPTTTYPAPGYPSTVYPAQSPSSLYPNGGFPGGLLQPTGPAYRAYRLLQGVRFRHTYVNAGDDADDLETNTTDASAVFALPNFLYSTQPIYIIPSFSLYLWDGPLSSTGADLPSSAYAGFIDFGWTSDPTRIVYSELGVRVGAFTDFDTFNSDSIRVLGKGIVNFRYTPATTLKGGVIYLDRNDLKLIPAGGILYQPNPNSRYDLFFPQPKLSHYWRTVGTRDIWWYLAGGYGGGSWTIERQDNRDDSIDINEIQVLLGIESGDTASLRNGKSNAFFEVGYAFDREIEYRFNPGDNIKLDDGFVFRAGIGY